MLCNPHDGSRLVTSVRMTIMTQQQTGAEQTQGRVGLLCLIVLIVILDNVGVSIMQLFASI